MQINQRLLTFGRCKRGRRGSALLDAILILPLLLALTAGTIEYGYFFYWKHTLQGAAREGARASIVPQAQNSHVIDAITQVMSAAGVNPDKYTVKIRNVADTQDLNIANVTTGTPILVKVTSSWGTVGVRPMGLIDNEKLVVGQTVMRKEG